MNLLKLLLRLFLKKNSLTSVYRRRMLLDTEEFSAFKYHRRIAEFVTSVKMLSGKYLHDRKVNLIYNPNTDIGNLLYKKGQFENSEIIYASGLLSNHVSGTVLDIGANIGVHVIAWAKRNSDFRFYAFEPTKDIYQILRESVKRNNLDNRIRVVPNAVSNKSGVARFYETTDDAYNSLKDTKRKNVSSVYDVAVISIDDFIADNKIDDLKFIKIDTEGFENEVILGAVNTIRKYMPDFFIEIYKGVNSNADPEGTVKRMIGYGYNAYVFKNNKLHPFVSHDDMFYNYFFSKKILDK